VVAGYTDSLRQCGKQHRCHIIGKAGSKLWELESAYGKDLGLADRAGPVGVEEDVLEVGRQFLAVLDVRRDPGRARVQQVSALTLRNADNKQETSAPGTGTDVATEEGMVFCRASVPVPRADAVLQVGLWARPTLWLWFVL
jgi:hypothetical protein